MKVKRILLTISLLFAVCITTKAQLSTPPIPDLQEKAAGYELVKAYKHFYTGTIIGWGGGVIFLIGIGEITNGSTSNGAAGLALIGGLAAIVGTALTIESYAHIGRAGKILMQRNDMTFGPTNNGIGLSIRF